MDLREVAQHDLLVNALFWRALFAFLVLPGTVAFLLPWLFLESQARSRTLDAWSAIPFGIGLLILLACVREFYVSGKGTLAPWSPPKHLVTSGLYRFSRNPMYIGVLLILAGWTLAFHSRSLAIYTAIVAVGFHVRVVFFEEPYLAAAHGEEFAQYKRRVRRWF